MKISTFSERLKEALKLRNVRQIDLSEGTKIPKSAISQYLSGNFEPKQDRLLEIALFLNVSEAWLMGFDVPMENNYDNVNYAKILEHFKKYINNNNEQYRIYIYLWGDDADKATPEMMNSVKEYADYLLKKRLSESEDPDQ